ncbi:hypothetical protein ACF0H5_002733 [Mactra antiquata]
MSTDSLRREFSEFSLRHRPRKTDHFQAGIIDSGNKKEQFKSKVPQKTKHFQPGIEVSVQNEGCECKKEHYQYGNEIPVRNEINLEQSPCRVLHNEVVTDLILDVTSTGSDQENSIEHDACVCISCGEKDKDLVCQHPLFEGSVCHHCQDELLESLYAIDDDGFFMYCTVCGQGGSLNLCEETDCGRSYCDKCLKKYLGRHSYQKIKDITDWTCLLCSVYNEDTHGKLLPRNDWRDQLVSFYNPVSCETYLEDPVGWYPGQSINILTMYDNTGAIRVAIEDLGITIVNYTALVNDGDAANFLTVKQVADVRWTELSQITSKEIKAICPIDLIVVNLPSEIFDICSGEPLSFDEQVKFMVRIESHIKEIDCINDLHHPVYYLIEGPVAMPTKTKNLISDVLQIEPSMMDAQFISPYIYPRYYWGNIPGMHRAVQCYNENKDNPQTLNMYLAKLPERQAVVKYLRNPAINFDTTRNNNLEFDTEYEEFLFDMYSEEEYDDSDNNNDDDNDSNDNGGAAVSQSTPHVLIEDECSCVKFVMDEIKAIEPDTESDIEDYFREMKKAKTYDQYKLDIDECDLLELNGKFGVSIKEEYDGLNKSIYTLPVMMEDWRSNMWITEVESIIGFPKHYSYLGYKEDIDTCVQAKLLKKSSSVHILKHIFKSLCTLKD